MLMAPVNCNKHTKQCLLDHMTKLKDLISLKIGAGCDWEICSISEEFKSLWSDGKKYHWKPADM